MGRTKILVVDDDPNVRRVVARLLSDEYDVEQASLGDEALQRLWEDLGIEAVISDVEMPGMDGGDLMRQCVATSRLPEEAFVFMSGNRDGRRAKGLVRGGSVVLPKPFDTKDLFLAVRKALTDAWDVDKMSG